MGMGVVTVATGGLPVVETPFGMPVTEATNLRGVPVTKVIGKPGLPVVFETIGVAAPLVPTTWNPADITTTTALTNGNLTITATTGTNKGARGIKGLSSGKYFWEATVVNQTSIADGIGLGTAGATLGISGTTCVLNRGTVYVNGSATGVTFGTYSNGDVVEIAADLTARRIWFRNNRIAPNWNANAANNPATGVGGIDISVLTGALFPFVVASGTGTSWTANFGATAFVNAVPAGFTAGWG